MKIATFAGVVIMLGVPLLLAIPQPLLASCGDFDGDGIAAVGDMVALGLYLFEGANPPADYNQADFDRHEKLTFDDLAYFWACAPICDFPELYCPPTEPALAPVVDPDFRIRYPDAVLPGLTQYAITLTAVASEESQAISLPLRIRIDGQVPQIDSIVTPTGSSYSDESGNAAFHVYEIISADSGIVVVGGAKWNTSNNDMDDIATIFVTVAQQAYKQPIDLQFVTLTPSQAAAGQDDAVFPMYLPPFFVQNSTLPLEPVLSPQCCVLPGDANDDGTVSIADAVYIIISIFGESPPYPCPGQVDADHSGGISIGDAVYLINYIFGGGPPPECGPQ